MRVEEGSTIAVYDLGGGTFDTAVLTQGRADDRFEAVGRPEGIDDLGGADFDAAVFRYVAEHTGGALADLDPRTRTSWPPCPGCGANAWRPRKHCHRTARSTIPVLLPGYQQQVRLVRSEFEALIEEPVRETVDALEESLAQSKLAPADLTAVLLIGGSSRIPLVAELISEQLDRPIAVDADPKSSICLGAAVSAVLSRAAAERAAAPASEDAKLPAPASGDEPLDTGGHVPARLASWSRKSTTAAGAFAALGHGPGHSHGGAHAPKPTVRLTAIAAAAALFTVLSATAAQSPGGFSDLTSVFVPQAGADSGPPAQAGGTGSVTGGGGAAAAGAAGDAQPLAGIDAGVQKRKSDAGPGLNVEASPTSKPSAAATKAPDGSPGPAAGGPAPAAGTGTVPGTTGGGTGSGTGSGTGHGSCRDAHHGSRDSGSGPGYAGTCSHRPRHRGARSRSDDESAAAGSDHESAVAGPDDQPAGAGSHHESAGAGPDDEPACARDTGTQQRSRAGPHTCSGSRTYPCPRVRASHHGSGGLGWQASSRGPRMRRNSWTPGSTIQD